MLNATDYLLLCLAEECAEIQKICTKSLRFGLDSHDPNDPDKIMNIDKLKTEINDVLAVTRIFEYSGFWNGEVQDTQMIIDKLLKLEHFTEISEKLGKLESKE